MVFTIKLGNNFYMLLNYNVPEHKSNWSEGVWSIALNS